MVSGCAKNVFYRFVLYFLVHEMLSSCFESLLNISAGFLTRLTVLNAFPTTSCALTLDCASSG